jgi:hypothetical protein
MGSGWVRRDFRGFGVYSSIKSNLKELAKNQEYTLLGTTKPRSRNESQAIISSAKHGILPVSFNYLKSIDPEAFQATCCCSVDRNHIKCDLRDKKCILSIDVENNVGHQKAAKNFTLSYKSSDSEIPKSTKQSIGILTTCKTSI